MVELRTFGAYLNLHEFVLRLLPGFLVRFFAKPYVSGNSIEKGIQKADKLWTENKIASTLDLLGEAVTNREEVQRTVNTYLELINNIQNKEYITVSVKPTALGIHESYEYCLENLNTILNEARKYSVKVTLDMEDHNYTDTTLDLYKELLPKYPTFGTVLQTRLYRTPDDVNTLSTLKTRIRLCIGIYKEESSIALTKKSEMKKKLIEMVKRLIDAGTFVEVATQDVKTIDSVLELVEKYGWTSEHLEFQQLMGVPIRKKQNELLQKGFTVRLYVPFATEWKYATPYLKRRLANNPKMAVYVLKHWFRRL